jgi:hypothetical protein
MASIDRADPVIMGHLLAQHRELHDLLVDARGMLQQPPGEVARADAAARLGALRQHLARHFVQEEQGGFMEESLTRMPRLARAVGRVMAEHPTLLAELDGLLEGLAARDSGGEAWRQAGRDFEAFASRLLAHERNENAVVQEGYNEDLGFAD